MILFLCFADSGGQRENSEPGRMDAAACPYHARVEAEHCRPGRQVRGPTRRPSLKLRLRDFGQ